MVQSRIVNLMHLLFALSVHRQQPTASLRGLNVGLVCAARWSSERRCARQTTSHSLELCFDEIGGKFALSAPAFQHSDDKEQIIAASTELLAAINTSLRLSVATYTGFDLHGIAVRLDDGTLHRTMLAEGGATYYLSGDAVAVRIQGVAAVGIAGSIGTPFRSREERSISLLQRDPAIADIAGAMATRPLTWAAMNTVYESVKGLMSTKSMPDKKRQDHQGLIDRSWISEEHSESFYRTAGHHRHGYPRTPIKAGVREMPYDEASCIVTGLFWRLIDELEPR